MPRSSQEGGAAVPSHDLELCLLWVLRASVSLPVFCSWVAGSASHRPVSPVSQLYLPYRPVSHPYYTRVSRVYPCVSDTPFVRVFRPVGAVCAAPRTSPSSSYSIQDGARRCAVCELSVTLQSPGQRMHRWENGGSFPRPTRSAGPRSLLHAVRWQSDVPADFCHVDRCYGLAICPASGRGDR